MRGLGKLIKGLVLLTVILNTITPLSVSADPFLDVKENSTHFIAINALKELGIINGYADNTFRANQKINRAEALKMLMGATEVLEKLKNSTPEGIAQDPVEETNVAAESAVESAAEIPVSYESIFTDVPPDSWFAPFIEKAHEKGIVNGNPDGTFKPENNINLAEALKIYLEALDRVDYHTAEYLNIEQLIVADTPADAWFVPYTKYALSKKLVNLYPDNTIDPNQQMSRGYLAEIIYRSIKAEEGYEFGRASWYGAAVQGRGTASGETFDMNVFTAAHKYLPFGTIVEVNNLDNGKFVEVKINDRGPYGHGRELDLSSGAFSQIGALSGVINIQYRVKQLPPSQ